MSELTLYQTNPNLSSDTVAMMVEKEMLLPVERCVHDNVYPHVVLGDMDTDYRYSPEWCPGAGIGDNEDE